jgi:hypothetical protein
MEYVVLHLLLVHLRPDAVDRLIRLHLCNDSFGSGGDGSVTKPTLALFTQRLPYGLKNLPRGLVGMTSEATCRKYQHLIASPKTVPIAYPQSETEMHKI